MDLSSAGVQNQSYSEQELAAVRRSRRACEEKLQALRDEIQRLCYEAEQLEAQIHRFDIALAPHNKLPSEILRQIFELCCVEPALIPGPQNGSIHTISHVCSLWRRIALGTPEFWANISVDLKKVNEHSIQVARQWLLRAESHPRAITISQTKSMLNVHSAWVRMLHSFVVHYPCKELHLSLPLTGYVPLLNELLASNAPLAGCLEVLDLDFVGTGRGEELFAPSTRLTKLLHFELVGKVRCQNLTTAIPWNQLRYLTLFARISPARVLDILSECTSLIRCHIQVEDGPVAKPSSQGPITLPVLRVLQLLFRNDDNVNTGSCVEQLIQVLIVPRLSHLTLGPRVPRANRVYRANLGTSAICELVQRSNGMPDLESLNLGTTSAPIDMRALLKHMPGLRALNARTGLFDSEAMTAIGTGKLAPRLHSILTGIEHQALEVLRMVELRYQNTSMTFPHNAKHIAEFSHISFPCANMSPSKRRHVEQESNRLKMAIPALSYPTRGNQIILASVQPRTCTLALSVP